ncbi:MAG: TPM domain-containing protein [Myxococcales bacterium]|nr:TPM domain-containing protein [Myxococcales bacterium]
MSPAQQTRGRLAWLIVLALVAGITWTATRGAPATAPVLIDAPVVDRADVLSPAAEAWIADRLRAHRDATGVQIAVLTVPTTHGVPIEDFSHAVASAWGGGRADADDGALLTLALEDRRMRLEVGRGLEDRIPDGRAAVIIEAMIPDLQRGDPRAAIGVALDHVIAATGGPGDALTAGLPTDPATGAAARPLPAPSLLARLTRAWGDGVTFARVLLGVGLFCWAIWLLLWLWRALTRARPPERARLYRDHAPLLHIGLALVALSPILAGIVSALGETPAASIATAVTLGIVALVAGFIALNRALTASFARWRHHPRPCPEGDGMTEMASEETAAAWLTPGQITEHAIASRIHDVWRCPNGHAHVASYLGAAPATRCPSCENATVRTGDWITVREATYSQSGQQKRTDTCAHCGEAFVHRRRIPRKQRTAVVVGGGGGGWSGGSSSGGGWSGGGGSFGGGGASGSW